MDGGSLPPAIYAPPHLHAKPCLTPTVLPFTPLLFPALPHHIYTQASCLPHVYTYPSCCLPTPSSAGVVVVGWFSCLPPLPSYLFPCLPATTHGLLCFSATPHTACTQHFPATPLHTHHFSPTSLPTYLGCPPLPPTTPFLSVWVPKMPCPHPTPATTCMPYHGFPACTVLSCPLPCLATAFPFLPACLPTTFPLPACRH